MQRVHDIESDTPIVPRAVAEAVWEEAAVWLKAALPRQWIGELIAHADAVYAHNPRFRRQLRAGGDTGRDWLWAFMRHWLGALIWRQRPRLHAGLPQSFSQRSPLPPPPVRPARLVRSRTYSKTLRDGRDPAELILN